MARYLAVVNPTADFFDEMAPRYDRDLVELGWDPEALVAEHLSEIPRQATIVDAGCGTGAVLASLSSPLRTLIGFDLSPRMVARARQRRRLRSADLRVADAGADWPVDEGSADVVLAVAMLEFVEDLGAALNEVARVTRVGGVALITVEDRCDWAGIEREAMEMRYGEFPLWRRTADELAACIPAAFHVEESARAEAYTVLERGFTCAYHVRRLRRR